MRPSKRYRVASLGQVDGAAVSVNAELSAAADNDKKPSLAEDPRGNMSLRMEN